MNKYLLQNEIIIYLEHTIVTENKPGFGFGFGLFYPNPKPEPENPIFSGTRPEPEPENPFFFGYFLKPDF